MSTSGYFYDAKMDQFNPERIFAAVVAAAILLIGLGMAGCPLYNVYHQRKAGEAELARAQSNRLVVVQEAEGKRESASKLAEADTIRAMGIAASNRIIGKSLEANPKYLTWLFYERLGETQNQVIYIPTEGSLPITEATRFPR